MAASNRSKLASTLGKHKNGYPKECLGTIVHRLASGGQVCVQGLTDISKAGGWSWHGDAAWGGHGQSKHSQDHKTDSQPEDTGIS